MEDKKIVDDPFGYSNQGENYDIFRPKYPDSFIQIIIQNTKNKDNYIDIASGTGILFFDLLPNFKGTCFANDRSAKQLEIARARLSKDAKNMKITHFIESDAYEISSKLQKPIKFDLITLAQALHWFDLEKLFSYLNSDLLKQDGTVAICGYFCKGFYFNYTEDQNFSRSGLDHYSKFYNEIKHCFDCDRDSLEIGHANFPFLKHYGEIQKFEEMKYSDLTIEEFVKYIKTYSAYNVYLQRYREKEDPVALFERNVRKSLNNFTINKNIPLKEKPIRMIMPFFLLILKRMVN